MRYPKALLAVAILVLAGWLYFGVVPSSSSDAGAATNSPASSSVDAEIERQIADLLMDSYQTGQAIEEDPELWELIRQLEPDRTIVLGH